MFVHCVYFWLKKDLSPAQVDQFVQGLQSLAGIPDVRHGFYGTPADTDRPIIDRTYSYGLVCAFESPSAHDAYQVHPVHDAFRENCSMLWEQVKIYDFA